MRFRKLSTADAAISGATKRLKEIRVPEFSVVVYFDARSPNLMGAFGVFFFMGGGGAHPVQMK